MVVPEGVPPCGGADTHAEIGDGTVVTLPAAIDDFEPGDLAIVLHRSERRSDPSPSGCWSATTIDGKRWRRARRPPQTGSTVG